MQTLAIMKERHFYKNLPNATNFLFDLGMESGMERPQYIIVGWTTIYNRK